MACLRCSLPRFSTPRGEGTCRTAKGDYNNIDYFLVSPGLEVARRSPATVSTWPARPHKPVLTYVQVRPKTTQILSITAPRGFPNYRGLQPAAGPDCHA
eukprot:913304-Pyramimonas_sp.AAC.1